MSKVHMAFKNIEWPNMLKILCYGTQKPQFLSKKQKITRLYKNYLRVHYDENIINKAGSREKRRIDQSFAKQEFSELLELPNDSARYQALLNKYEQFIDDNYDITHIAFNNQPYSQNSSKLWIFTDEQLAYDPFGYYKQKTAHYNEKSFAAPFYEDYPIADDKWKFDTRYFMQEKSFALKELYEKSAGITNENEALDDYPEVEKIGSIKNHNNKNSGEDGSSH